MLNKIIGIYLTILKVGACVFLFWVGVIMGALSGADNFDLTIKIAGKWGHATILVFWYATLLLLLFILTRLLYNSRKTHSIKY